MNRKKTLYGLGLLALILVLGVGYAAVSEVTLNIDGSATVASEALKVSFNGVTDTEDDGKVVASSTDNSLDASIQVTNLTLNEAVSATYTIKNQETDVDANVIKKQISNDKPEFFEVTTSVDDSAETITAGGTGTVTVTVRLIKTPIETSDSTANIQIDLTASPVTQ